MKQRSFLYKLVTCLIAGFVNAALWLLIGRGQDNPLFQKVIIFLCVAISLITSVIVPFIWQYLQNKKPDIADKMYGWLYTIIRYTIALDLAIFGWKKFFHLQFIVPNNVAALPLNQQSGETLTWYYFGHSYAFGAVVAGFQIAGAAMLLFRRTWLLGALILFALLVNIASVDFFYQMNAGALSQSAIMTLGTFYLIMIDYDRLKQFFFKADSNLVSISSIKTNAKIVLRIAFILLPVIYNYYSATH